MSNKPDQDISKLKVALVYDWATTRYGGAELVLKTLLDAFPNDPLFTTIASDNLPWVEASRLKTTWLQKFPTKNHRLLVPLMPLAAENLDLSEFEIVISVSTGIALGVLTKPHQLHVCYLLSPPRYIYDFEEAYHQDRSILNRWPLKYGTDLSRRYLRWWQNQACLRPDAIIPLSNRVRLQAEKWYSRSIEQPIYPPVLSTNSTYKQSIDKKQPTQPFWLVVNRIVAYKRTDLAIQAALTAGHRLLIVGDGPDYNHLLNIANQQSIEISNNQQLDAWLQSPSQSAQPLIACLKSIDSSRLDELFHQAQVVISPGIDDFGLVPLEAVIHSTPTVWHAKSGVGEILKSDVDGFAVTNQTSTNLLEAIDSASRLSIPASRSKFLQNQFSTNHFVTSLTTQLQKSWYTLNASSQ